MDIYLTVPDYRQRGLNVAIGQRDAGTRYVAEVATYRDENTGSSEKPVQIARKNQFPHQLQLCLSGMCAHKIGSLPTKSATEPRSGQAASP